MKIRYINLAIVTTLVIVLCGCGESEEQRLLRTKAERERLDAENRAALKIAVTPTMDCLPLFLLKDSVLYDTTKVDVRLQLFTAHMDCDTALLRKHVEGTMTDLVRVEHMRRTGHPMGYATATEAHWKLLANKRSRLKDLSQLSDRLVAMTRFSATDLLTDRAQKKGKTKYQPYKIQINDVNIRLQMLQNNEMDALWLMEPLATAARMTGANVLVDTRKDSVNLGVMAFRVDVLADDHRYAQIQELLKAYDKAVDQLNRNGIQAYAPIIKKYMAVEDRVIQAMPVIIYKRSSQPLPKDIATAASLK